MKPNIKKRMAIKSLLGKSKAKQTAKVPTTGKQRPPEELTVPKTTFICEQDGDIEKEFKANISPSLSSRSHVQLAFLTRVEYDKPEELNVALCIRMNKVDDQDLKKEIGKIFSGMFGSHEHLDIIFLREEQVKEISKACNPFYKNKLPTRTWSLS